MEDQLNAEDSDLFLGIEDKNALIQRYYELQGNTDLSSMEELKNQHCHYKVDLRISEIIAFLKKNNQEIPNICCFHCPRLMRILRKDNNLIDEYIKRQSEDDSNQKCHDVFYSLIVVFKEACV